MTAKVPLLKSHPAVIGDRCIPMDGLHLVVAGKAWWVSPAMIRSWIAADPDSPTTEDHSRSAVALARILKTIAALREEAADAPR